MSTAAALLAEADTLSHTAAVLRHRAATLAEGIATMSEAEWDAGWALCALREELRRWEPAWAALNARQVACEHRTEMVDAEAALADIPVLWPALGAFRGMEVL